MRGTLWMCEFPHTQAFALPRMGVSRMQCPKEVDVMGVAVRNAGIGAVSCCDEGSEIGVVRVSLLSRQLCTSTCVVELISTIFWDYNNPFFLTPSSQYLYSHCADNCPRICCTDFWFSSLCLQLLRDCPFSSLAGKGSDLIS